MQQHAGLRAGDPVFPSLGSTMGGVATQSYVVGEAAPASGGSLQPVTYIAFPSIPATNHMAAAPLMDEVRTIFVTGFPDAVHERELHNLCRFIPGYEASQVVFKANQQPQVFVLFSTPAHARQAMDALAGLPFDVQLPGSRGELSQPSSQNQVNPATKPAANGSAVTSGNSVSAAAAGTTAPGAVRVGGGSGDGSEPAPTGGDAAAAPAAAGSAGGLASRLGAFVNNRATILASGASGGLSAPSAGLGVSSSGAVGTGGAPIKYNLRCEMAHKNLYIKEGDPTVRTAHRRIILSNNPGLTSGPGTMTGINSSGAVTHVALSHPTSRVANANGVQYVTSGDVTVYGAGGPGPNSGSLAQTVTMHPLAASAAGLSAPMAPLGPHQPAVSVGTPLGFLPVTNRGDNPPCNTLFIGNLSDQVSELELLHLLSVQPGYKQMKLVRGPRQVSCFVEFEDTPSACAVHNSYQGAVLASSDRGGIRIQYSKNPFGKRSSIPGSNASSVLRGAVGIQESGDLSSAVAAAAGGGWPGVHSGGMVGGMPGATYHAAGMIAAGPAGTGMGMNMQQAQPTHVYY